MLHGAVFQKGGGTPNPFTVSQMPFFRGVISKVCRKNKVSEGISKKAPLAAGGSRLLRPIHGGGIFQRSNIRYKINR
jgi:hypothetical protein